MEIPGDSTLLNGAILLSFLALFFLLTLPKRYAFAIGASSLLFTVLSSGWLAFKAIICQPIVLTLFAGSFAGDILIQIDGLSAWFLLLVDFTVLTGFFYGSGYLQSYGLSAPRAKLHWILLIFFHLSMLLVCMVQHGFAFLLVWEIMSLTSMLLVLFDHEDPVSYRAALNYFVQMHIGVTFLTVGFIWAYHQTGSFSFEAFPAFFSSHRNIWIFLLFFAGFGIKAGFVPFHSWLPHAHPAAPAHVSGIMSGVIVKLGIYGIFRMITFLKSDILLIGEIVLTVSVLSGLYGILNAAVHRDYKRMLAYCTIENIGIIGAGMGIGLIGMGTDSSLLFYLGFGGSLLHVLNHSLFKSLLFYSAGSVYQQSHTRNMESLGGLIRTMPQTAVIFLIGALAIGGLPPFNGFISEFLIYLGLIEGVHSQSISLMLLFVLSLAGLSLIGGLSVLTFTKAFGTIFLGQPRKLLHSQPKEVSYWMLIPQYCIIIVMMSIAFFPSYYMNAIGKIVASIHPNGADARILDTIVSSSARISLYSFILVGTAFIIWLIRSSALRGREVRTGSTWGCGYVAPDSRQQYTGKSYSKPLGKIFNALLIERKQFEEIGKGEIFPEKRFYVSHYLDFFEHHLIKPITGILINTSNYFRFIQNGRIQSYVLYGILFIIVVLILSVFNVVA